MTVKVMGLACPRGVLALLSGMTVLLSVAFLARFRRPSAEASLRAPSVPTPAVGRDLT
jgi:hypothetical protein